MARQNNINCLIVDDEYPAQLLVEDYVNKAGGITIIDKCKSPQKAAEIIVSQPVELLFLDINMPNLSGTELLKSLPYKPVTVFTTAYSEYAVDAFELDAVDYLVKPFGFERFMKAVLKARERIKAKQGEIGGNPLKPEGKERDFITVKSEYKIIKIYLDEIDYVEGFQEYVKIICGNDTIITYQRLKNMEAILPSDRFMRVHRSYIIAKNKVKAFNNNMLEIGNTNIPVSRDKREKVVATIFK